MRLKDITETTHEELSKMSKQQLQNYIKEAGKYALSRRTRALKSLEKSGLPTPYIYRQFDVAEVTQGYHVKDEEGKDMIVQKTYSAPKGRARLLEEYKKFDTTTTRGELIWKATQLNIFLNSVTSTVEGWKTEMTKRIKTIEKAIQERYGISGYRIPKTRYADFWNILNRVEDYNATISTNYEVHKDIINILQNKNFKSMSNEEISSYLINQYISKYTEKEAKTYGDRRIPK